MKYALVFFLLLLNTPATAQLRATRTLEIRSEDFSRIGAFAHDDTAVYIYDQVAKQVFVHDAATGRRTRTIGRAGKGPGEFQSVIALGFLADTLWAADPGNSRFALFRNGEPAGTVPVMMQVPKINSMRYSIARGQALLDGGEVLFQHMAGLDAIESGQAPVLPAYRATRDGMLLGKLFDVVVRNSVLAIRAPGVTREMGGAFRLQPMFEGDLMAWSVTGRAVYRLNLATYTLTRYWPDGRVAWTHRGTYEPRKPRTAAVLDSVVGPLAHEPEVFGIASATVLRDVVRKALHVPEFEPPVSRLVTGRDGTVWVQRFYAGGSTATWDLVSDDGRVLGSVQLPASVGLLAGERAQAWGVVKDADDVPVVVRYRIGR